MFLKLEEKGRREERGEGRTNLRQQPREQKNLARERDQDNERQVQRVLESGPAHRSEGVGGEGGRLASVGRGDDDEGEGRLWG